MDGKDVVRRIYEDGYNRADESVFAELYHPTFVHHSKSLHDTAPGGEGERESMLRFRAAIPDVNFQIVELLADGDKVVARLRITGRPQQAFADVFRAGDVFDRHAVALFRIQDGQVAEEWFFTDAGTSTS
jgi:predicted ester cyclase